MNKYKYALIALILLILFVVGSFGVLKVYRHFSRPKPVAPKEIVQKKITLIEGWTASEMSSYLQKQGLLSMAEFDAALRTLDDPKTFSFLGSKPKSQDLEGFLFPDTYLIAEGSNAEIILTKLLENFAVRFNQASKDAVKVGDKYQILGNQKMSLYELVTLASIVEKETGRNIPAGDKDSKQRLDEERKVVAGIFYNRLRVGQGLQSDATINYVTKNNRAAPTNEDLAVNSPYNTYKYKGLPPGPISNPSLSSLIAVLYPTKTDYFYFLHTQPSGNVYYAKTFEEHVRNKNKYLK